MQAKSRSGAGPCGLELQGEPGLAAQGVLASCLARSSVKFDGKEG